MEKPIKGFEGLYSITDSGSVITHGGFRRIDGFLKLVMMNKYLAAQLMKDGHRRGYRVHRLVAEAFVANSSQKPFVNHINGNKLDNRAINLEWCTTSENHKHAFKMGLMNQKGEKNAYSKLTEEIVRKARKMRKEGMMYKDIAKKLGFSKGTIYDAVRGINWAHIN